MLTHGELDNGRGFARQKLFRHKHEMESGRTSSVGNDILGFDSKGNIINKSEIHGIVFFFNRVKTIGGGGYLQCLLRHSFVFCPIAREQY